MGGSLDASRRRVRRGPPRCGFLTVGEVAALAPGVSVLDSGSTLVGADVLIGSGTVVYPGVVLETRDGGRITVGPGVRLGPGAVTVLAVGSDVTIGDAAELGPGSVTVTSAVGAPVRIGAAVRLRGGAVVEGPASLGRGSQVLGSVAVRDVVLDGGGGHTEPDPDLRGAVVKGAGRVHGVRLAVGEVVAVGDLADVGDSARTSQVRIERQRAHHPDAPRRRALD